MLDVEKFIRDGWVIIDLGASPVSEIAWSLENRTSRGLENIHDNYNDASVKKLHLELSEYFWREEFSLKLAEALLPQIQELIGPDVMVQYYPYVRIARPGCPEDNIGFHKDTQYGQTPYELAVHIPFVDLDKESAIRVISGSHLMPESAFVGVTPDGKRVEKGSIDNKMGKPYMPKCLAVPVDMETTPLAMKVGQAAIFSPAIFHGQEVNYGNITRVSCDLRFVSAHHADKVRVGRVHAGYVPVSQSPTELVAQQYYGAQK
jgi:ectoine hydroxylase-related dioxygenase (phytanoyl-CoA dioxygenase family)